MGLKKFQIEIQELLARVVEVQANTVVEAKEIVENGYRECTHVLDYNDFAEVNFIDLDSQSERAEMKMLIKDVIEYLYVHEKKHFEESDEPQNHLFSKLERLKNLID